MSRARKMIKDSTGYAVCTVASQVIGIFTSIAMRRFLTPEMMGIWATFLLVLNYALFTDMGVFSAIEVKIPYFRGKNENDEMQNMRNTAFTFAIALSVAMATVSIAASFLLSSKMQSDIILGIRIFALIIAATLFYNLYVSILRGDKNFSLISKVTVFNSIAMLLFVCSLTYLFKLKGIYLATLLATSASWLYIRSKTDYKLKLCFNPNLIKSLSKIGLPMLIGGIVYTVLLSIDRIMIVKMLGPAFLGYYSIAMLALTYVYTFPNLLAIVISPNMQEDFGKNDSRERILEYVKQPSIILAYMFPLVLAAAYYAIPLLVEYVLPKYIPGIASMKMLLIGCFFISLVPLAQNFIIAINKQIVLIPITAAAVFTGLVLNYAMIKMGYGITGVALSTSIAYFVCFVIMYFYVLSHCEKFFMILLSFVTICAPFLYALIIVFALEHFVKCDNITRRTIIHAPVFLIAYSPVLWYANKKTMFLSRFFKRGNNVRGGVNEAYYSDTVL